MKTTEIKGQVDFAINSIRNGWCCSELLAAFRLGSSPLATSCWRPDFMTLRSRLEFRISQPNTGLLADPCTKSPRICWQYSRHTTFAEIFVVGMMKIESG